VVFLPVSLRVEWINLALQTITPKHRDLRQISIHLPYDRALASVGVGVRQNIGEPVCAQWLELDRLLVQFWESHRIRPKITYIAPRMENKEIGECMGCLLPEIMKRRVIDLIEWNGY
jgi:hypothetical protein